jgi:hypothetical protein
MADVLTCSWFDPLRRYTTCLDTTPGMGKSTALLDAVEHETTASAQSGIVTKLLDLRSYGDESRLVRDLFESPQIRAWQSGNHELCLFVDSLDECLLRVTTVATLLIDQLQHLPRDRLRLRIACRTGDWPRILEDGLKDLWGEQDVKVLELAPLRKSDVREAAASNGLDADAFIQAVSERDVVPLALKPVTVEFLIGAFQRGSLPSTQAELYHEGCRRLCEERNLSRASANLRGEFDSQQRLVIAARIAAVMILCRRALVRTDSGISLAGSDELTIGDLTGHSELCRGIAFPISERALRETLTATGLFSSRGAGLLGWAHQTYAEFLAAKYLVDHSVRRDQLAALLMHHEDRLKVIPQLHETAAWVANLDKTAFQWLADTDPYVLLNSDVPPIKEDRRTLTRSLLAAFDAGDLLDDDWGLRQRYKMLAFPDLPAELLPYLVDRSKHVVVRRVAIDIATACDCRDLQGSLADVVLDASDHHRVRWSAIYALRRIGDRETIARLVPLVHGDCGPDPDDDLKAMALEALCPSIIPRADIFVLLTEPQNEWLVGAYDGFILKFAQSLTEEELPVALQWVVRQPHRMDMRLALCDLLDAILRLGWQHAEKPAIAVSMADAVRHRVAIHDAHLVQGRDLAPVEPSQNARRAVLANLVETARPDDIFAVAAIYSHPPLLVQDDLPWALSEFEASQPQNKSKWIAIAKELFDREAQASRIDAVLSAADSNPILAEAFASRIQAIEITSERAQHLREQSRSYRRLLDASARQSDPKIQNHPTHALDEIEAGTLHAWWRLTRELSFDRETTQYRDDWMRSLASLPGWLGADELTRARIVSAAKRYIEAGEAPSESTLGARDYRRNAIDGFRALELIHTADPSWLRHLDPARWQTWIPSLFRYPRADDSSNELMSIAYVLCPEAVLRTMNGLIEAEDVEGDYVSSHTRVDRCWDVRIADALLAQLTAPRRSAGAIAELLSQGLRHGDLRFGEQALAMIANIAASEASRARAVEAAAALIMQAPEISWVPIWKVFQSDISFGHAVVRKVAVRCDLTFALPLAKLSSSQVADLYTWVEKQFPTEEDLPRTRITVTDRERIGMLRNSLLRHLETSGDPKSVAAIDQLISAFGHNSGLKYSRVIARRSVLRKTWLPPAPSHLLALTGSPERRLVESGTQLMAAIRDSLDRLAKAFKGETPASRDVWDDRGNVGWFPNDENTFSDYVKRHLERDLAMIGIVLNREVEVKKSIGPGTGARTDIQVDAVRRTGSMGFDVITAVVEVKGCWHSEVTTAMDTQLRERYLEGLGISHGLYLVAWFDRSRWSDADSRKHVVPWRSVDEARVYLNRQALSLSGSDITIEAYVVDASLW